jgi:uncharacterized membrane protein
MDASHVACPHQLLPGGSGGALARAVLAVAAAAQTATASTTPIFSITAVSFVRATHTTRLS